MNAKKENIIARKSYDFALEIVELYKMIIKRKEYILSKQLLRSGTSIGANVHESISSESKRDFIHKLGISLKEARETSYWLNLLKDGKFITEKEFQVSNTHCREIINILSSIILTIKRKYFPGR